VVFNLQSLCFRSGESYESNDVDGELMTQMALMVNPMAHMVLMVSHIVHLYYMEPLIAE
jgi:hypothetical protein